MLTEILKKETQQIHKEIERKSLAKKILDHSITANEYNTLLLQHLKAYKNIQSKLDTSPVPEASIFKTQYGQQEKISLIERDLPSFHDKMVSDQLSVQDFEELGALIGCLYVVEGANMGHMIISRHIQNCRALEHRHHHFYAKKDGSEVMGRWNRFKADANALSLNEPQTRVAVHAAVNTFAWFGHTD